MKRPTGALHHDGPEQLTYWGRAWRYVLAPVYYWLDLLDTERRPSHSKVTWTVAFGFGLGLLVFMVHLILADHDAPTPTELAFILGFAALVFALAGGLDGYKAWLKTRGGGTVDAFADTVRQAIDSPGKPPLFEEDELPPPGVSV